MESQWASVGVFWASVITAFVAISATVVNYLFIRSQTNPQVVVFADADPLRPSIIVLVIQNTGRTMARNVRFELPPNFPQKAYGFLDAPMPETMDTGPLVTGIPSLGPNCRRVITWGQYHGLYKSLGDEAAKISIRYRGPRFGPFLPAEIEDECIVDIKSLATVDVSQKNWDKEIAEQLKGIAEGVRALSKGEGSN